MPITTIVVDQGLQLIGDRASSVAGAGSAINAMGIDDTTTALVAGDTNITAATNKDVNAFDSTPTRSGQVVSHVATWGTGEGNFTIRRITLLNGGAGVTTGLMAGISGHSIVKDSTYSLTLTVKLTYTSA